MLKRMIWTLALIGMGLHDVAPVVAQSTPIGNELQVNVFTTGNQRTPHVASDAAGNYIVIWESNFTTFGRQIFSDGTPGPEFFVSLSSNSNVARAPGSQFVVVSEFNSGFRIQQWL